MGSSSGPEPRPFFAATSRRDGVGGQQHFGDDGRPTATLKGHKTSPGTTGFDAVGSWGWWRVEVPGGLVKHPGKP